MAVSCGWEGLEQGANGNLVLSEDALSYDTEVITKAQIEANGNYAIFINDATSGDLVLTTTYSAVKGNGNKISLPEGSYTFTARSTAEEVPAAAFEEPVYGASKSFSIQAGQDTQLGSIVCNLLQTKVTISYNDDFLASVTGDCTATVSVTPTSPLVYAISYANGTASYDQSAGYFAVNNGTSTSMEVVFKGSIEGKSQKMTKVFSNIQPNTWHQIKFIKKVGADGNSQFTITIDDLILDEELGNLISGAETSIGEDPMAPAGDGGITLESTCSIDITNPITVPALPAAGEPANFTLTMKATVPGQVKKFTVEIASTSDAFVTSVKSVNDGQSELDLVNPSAGAQQVFTEILPFPYGAAVKDKDEIDFDLSDAQTPILAFPGTHTFTMHVMDKNGCKKDINIVMVVE